MLSVSTPTHSLKTCSFSLHHNTISPSIIRSQQGNLLLGGENFQLFGGDYCADKDLDKIYAFNERFYGMTS
jgi:hypothetical protein